MVMRIDEIASRVKHPLDEEFWRWFGNSKVVDKNGKPLIVYHGTKANFSTFEKGDIGFHVGTNAQATNRLKKKEGHLFNILPLYASIQTPLRLEDAGEWREPYDLLSVLSTSEAAPFINIKQFHEEATDKNVKYWEFLNNTESTSFLSTKDELNRQIFGPIIAKIRIAIEKLGYDGIVYRNRIEGRSDSWIVFHPNQLKSIYAIHFNPNDGNIFD